ncbi:hypothetical protein SKUL_28 [Pseudomonas phage Skulduggery]|uniref:Uncharacterized protein n=1 Tax=Pseudomonas phage Skulduggery TaxID=2006671 RepID=A0A1Y0T2N3_9CAUD|nr:DarB-like antirestriction [Pseudomonas phage Skulduggery]ARV77127.1 hypothetical protein SKUL_28 [Pseudomonas phage Skulduggery]
MSQVPLSPLQKVLSQQSEAPAGRGLFKPESSDGGRAPSTRAASNGAAKVPDEYLADFKGAAEQFDVPANVLMGMGDKESGFNPNAIGDKTEWGQAKGMMQYLDPTASNLKINPYNAKESIYAAARQIRERLDKGMSLDDAVREHFAGPDRKKWGKKTAAYAEDVFERSKKFENAFGALGATSAENSPELAPEGGYTAEEAQAALEKANAAEPGRFTLASAEDIAAAEQAGGMIPEQDDPADMAAGQAIKGKGSKTGAPGSDGFLSATGKQLKNIPGNFKEAGAGIIRSIGEGVDDQTLVANAAQAGIIDGLRDSGIITMKPSKTGFKGQDVPTLPDGKEATTSQLAAYIRQHSADLLTDENGDMAGLKQSVLTAFGDKLGKEARKNRLEVNPDGPAAKYGSMIIGSTAEMLPALLAGAVTKNPNITLAMIGTQSKGGAYERGREGGLNPDEAGGYSTAQAMAEAIPSILPVHAILKPGGNFFKGILAAGAAEGAQEAITAALQAGIDKGTIDPNMTWEEARQRIVDGIIVGAGAGGSLRAGMDGTARARAAMESPEARLAKAMEAEVDNAQFTDEGPRTEQADSDLPAMDADQVQQHVAAEQAAQAQAQADADAQAAEAAPPAAPQGPLARAAAAAPIPVAEPGPLATETAPESAIRPDAGADAYAGQPGDVLRIELPGIEPFQATIEGYVDGDVMLKDNTGDRFQITREELAEANAQAVGRPAIETGLEETSKVADALAAVEEQIAQVEAEAKPAPKAEPETTGKAADDLSPYQRNQLRERGVTDERLGDMSTEEANAELAKPTKKTLEQMTEKELRQELKFLGTQAKNSGGWNKAMMAERRKVEAAIAKVGTNTAEDLGELKNMGGGVVDGMYDSLWSRVEAGKVSESSGGKPNHVLQAAKILKDSGSLKTREQFKEVAGLIEKAAEGKTGTDRDAAIRKVMRDWSESNAPKPASDVKESASKAPKTASDVKESGTDAKPKRLPMEDRFGLAEGEENISPGFFRDRDDPAHKGTMGSESTLLRSIEAYNQYLEDMKHGKTTFTDDPVGQQVIRRSIADKLEQLRENHGYTDEQIAAERSRLPSEPLPGPGDKVPFGTGYATVIEASPAGVKIRQRGKENTLTVSQFHANVERGKHAGMPVVRNGESPAPTSKWFGTQERADAYLKKQKLTDTHAVEKSGERFNIVEKKAAETAPKAQEAAPAPKPAGKKPAKAESPHLRRARDQVGDVGDKVQFSVDVGYTTAGETYTINGIDKDGTVHVRSERGGTTISRGEMSRAQHQGVQITKIPKPAETAPGQVEKPAKAAKPAPSENKIFTEDAAAEARKVILASLGTARSGIDPKLAVAGLTLAGYHIEKGARSFAAYAQAMTADLGDIVRPYLKSWYMAAKYDPRMSDMEGLSQAADVDAYDTSKPIVIEETADVPSAAKPVEQDSQQREAAKPVDAAPAVDAGRADAGGTGKPGRGADAAEGAGRSDKRVPVDGAAAGRERGDNVVHREDGEFRPSQRDAGSAERDGSGPDSSAGTPVSRTRAKQIAANATAVRTAELAERLKAQKAAANVPTKRGDKASIDEALPLLLPPQREDVLKAEIRLANNNGVLFTNGTGTGKTASGMGFVKRMINDGKPNGVILVPNDKIASDWVAFGKMLGVDVKQLSGLGDNGGSGPVVTTYANFGDNATLAQRSFDWFVPDESHYLSSNENGDTTGALNKLRALTGHHGGFETWLRDKHAGAYKRMNDTYLDYVASKENESMTKADHYQRKEKFELAQKDFNAIRAAEQPKWAKRWADQTNIPKVVFLSATPFAYAKNVDYAEGFLFHYRDPSKVQRDAESGRGYNVGNAQQQFMIQHFGYRMRNNKLTAPEAGVDSQVMEQQFNTWLKEQGALSGRRLDVPHDYDRKFLTVEGGVGKKIDDAMRFLREGDEGAHRKVFDAVNSAFDHQSRMYLLEALKARAVVDMVKADLAAGRKVAIFHDYNQGGGTNPFKFALQNIRDRSVREQAQAILSRPMFQFDMEGLKSPIETLGEAFPQALFFNGTVSKAKRRKNADAFNDDANGPAVIVAQSDAAREGVSLHDTTGKHPRVLYNLGMPTRPVKSTQIEGRTYRTGQASDAMFRYLTTGTGWETAAFASKIAERASTAENLALGEDARNLKSAFVDAYNNAEPFAIRDTDGTGGKERDRGDFSGLSDFDKAKSFYWANQRNNKRRDQREGADYYATPEPVGLKKVQWADIQTGDRVLEPSAGHGAIARFFPQQTDVTMIEPSYDLSQRAGLANGSAKVINDTFESHHITNKYEAIVMNPPFGSGGKTAIEHLEKAGRHLAEGGRIVATIPRGGMADRRLDAFFAGDSSRNLHTVADIQMPGVAFERAGTGVATRVLVLERRSGENVDIQPVQIDLSDVTSTKELFDRLEGLDLPKRAEGVKSSLLDDSGQNGNRYSAKSLDTDLRQGELGEILSPMIDSGRLILHDEAPKGMNALTQGWTDKAGNINLVADQLTADTAMPVLLHEAFHSGGQSLMTSDRWQSLMGRLNGFYKAAEAGTLKGPWADAYRRVQNAVESGDSMSRIRAIEELGAYAIENHASAPKGIRQWADNVVGMVKDWLARKFGIQVGDVTPAQLRSLAVAALRGGRTTRPETDQFSMGEQVNATELANALRGEYPGLKLDLMGKNGRATLSRIVLPEGSRNAGAGTAIMKRITDWADQTGTTLALSPTADFGGSKGRLVAFYKRQGFVENKGRNRDFEVSESMLREPKAPEVKSSIKAPTDKEVDGWFSRQLTDAMAGPKSKGQYSLLALAPMDRMIEELSGNNVHAKEYLNLKRDMDAYRAEKHAKYDSIAQKWLNLNVLHPKETKEMARIMHDATIAKTDPSEGFQTRVTKLDRETVRKDPASEAGHRAAERIKADDARRAEHDPLQARFDALPPALKEQFKKVRDTYKDMTEELDAIMVQNLSDAIDIHGRKAERTYDREMQEIKDEGLTGQDRADAEAAALKKYNGASTKQRMNKKARLTMLRQQFESNRLEGPYFPLARFGDLFVTVRDRNTGEVLSFNRFENSKEQQKFAKEAASKGKVSTGLLSSMDDVKGAVDPRFVADIEEILNGTSVPDAVKDQVWQRYIESMPELSLRKGFIHRKNREGYTQDATRAFANRMFHGSHQLGRLKFGAKMQESIELAGEFANKSADPVRDTAVTNELARRHDYVMNPKGGAFAQKLTSAAFIYQLSMSPAAALVNMSQTVMIGVPVIGAKFGMTKTLAEMGKASAAFVGGRGRAENSSMLTADEKAAMKEAYRTGLIESTQSHSLAGVGDGVGVQYSAVRTRVMGIISWMFHQTERTNREVTFLAAYRLAKKEGQTQDQAIKTGADLTYKTHFDYANTNRPRAMHGDTAKVALVFRNYQINMLWRLFRDTHQVIHADGPEVRKEAITQLAGISGMMALHAGVKGVWMYGIAMMIASIIFGDDAEDEFKKATIETLGPTAGGILLNGVPGHLTGTALSGRIGMGDLWFRSPDRQLEGKDEWNYWQQQLLGFMPSIGQNIAMGIQQGKDGNIARGIETAAPKSIKDLMRAYRFATEGATTMRGDTLVDNLKPTEIAAQALGFTPAVVAEQYERNSSLKRTEKAILDKRRGLMDKFAMAYKLGDMEKRKELTEKIKEFNRENRSIPITPQTLQQSVKSRVQRSQRTDGGIYLNPKLDKQLRDNLGPAVYR